MSPARGEQPFVIDVRKKKINTSRPSDEAPCRSAESKTGNTGHIRKVLLVSCVAGMKQIQTHWGPVQLTVVNREPRKETRPHSSCVDGYVTHNLFLSPSLGTLTKELYTTQRRVKVKGTQIGLSKYPVLINKDMKKEFFFKTYANVK